MKVFVVMEPVVSTMPGQYRIRVFANYPNHLVTTTTAPTPQIVEIEVEG